MYVRSAAPYCGFCRDDNGKLVVAEAPAHILVSAPTETGKTRGVLAPASVLWGGPAVCVSSKDDLMWLVCQRRWGPKQVIDLRPDYSPVYPPDAQVRSFDPTALISTPDQAVTTANTMMQMSAVGLGSGIDQVSDAGIWESNTEAPLAAMLYAASPRGNGKGIEWVLLAVDNLEEDKHAPDAPGWHSAARCVAGLPLFRNALLRTLAMDPRQRDSIALTMRKAVTPWMRLGLRGMTEPTFDESFLAGPDATLFILAPAEGSIAGAAVTLLEHLVRSWRGKTARKEMLHRLLIVIDEAANVAPMPALRRHVSEGRGLGVNLLLSVQGSSPVRDGLRQQLCPRAARHLSGRADHVWGRRDGDAAARRAMVTRNHPPPRDIRSGQHRQDTVLAFGSQSGLPAPAPTESRPRTDAAARDGGYHHRAAGLAGFCQTV